jgi:hypothetical protein
MMFVLRLNSKSSEQAVNTGDASEVPYIQEEGIEVVVPDLLLFTPSEKRLLMN